MASINDVMKNNNYTIKSINDLNRMYIGESIWEVGILPHLLKITKTDMGLSFGLPSAFPDGSYDKNGEPKMIRLQDVIHKGAWKKNQLRPQPHNLPPGFTIVHMSLMTVAIDFTPFFLLYYSKRYKSLPLESKKILYNGARVCALLEAYEEKVHLQSQNMDGFACEWAYQQYREAQKIKENYIRKIPKINWSINHYGYGKEVREARQHAHYEAFNAQMSMLAAIQPPALPSLPLGIPEFRLLEEPPTEMFAAGA